MIESRRSFIVGIKTTKLLKNEILFLRKYKPWGIILFSRNINDLNQVKLLVQNIKKIFRDKNYPIFIDEEGGPVSRLKNIIDSSIFSAKFFGNLYSKNKKKFNIYSEIYVKQISYLLNEIGININTVPVLDIKRKKTSKVIGDRSYSSLPKNVSKIGDFFIKAFTKEKIGTVIKHIPGHGFASVDSHKLTPIVNEKANIIFKNDFKVFKSKKSFFAMTAHIIYKDLDPNNTATHSKKIIKIIRNKIRFKNIIISDDISMKALKFSIKINTLKAFAAGCNLVLHCNGNLNEMKIVAKNSPVISTFLIKKTSQFYSFLS